MTCFVWFDLIVFCVHQVIFQLNWANWWIWRSWIGPLDIHLSSNKLTGALPSFYLLTCVHNQGDDYPLLYLLLLCFGCALYTRGPIPAELGQLVNLTDGLDLSKNQLTGTTQSLFPLTCIQYDFRTSRMGWLVFLLCFVYLRSHSGWIGPLGEFRVSTFMQKPAYRYAIPLSP